MSMKKWSAVKFGSTDFDRSFDLKKQKIQDGILALKKVQIFGF